MRCVTNCQCHFPLLTMEAVPFPSRFKYTPADHAKFLAREKIKEISDIDAMRKLCETLQAKVDEDRQVLYCAKKHLARLVLMHKKQNVQKYKDFCESVRSLELGQILVTQCLNYALEVTTKMGVDGDDWKTGVTYYDLQLSAIITTSWNSGCDFRRFGKVNEVEGVNKALDGLSVWTNKDEVEKHRKAIIVAIHKFFLHCNVDEVYDTTSIVVYTLTRCWAHPGLCKYDFVGRIRGFAALPSAYV